MIIYVLKRILHKKNAIFLDDHLQEAGPSRLLVARGRPLQIISCQRPTPPDYHLQEAGPSG